MAGYGRRGYPRRRGGSGLKMRLMIALVMIAFAMGSYFMSTRKEYNPITGKEQRIAAISVEEEIAMGIHAAPKMAQQHGGLHDSQSGQDLVDKVGFRLVNMTAARNTPYKFDFHLLADERTVNAFALPGGQIFITAALFKRLETEDELAGVLGHEIGHVVGRHSLEQMAKAKRTQGISTALIMAGTGGAGGGQMGAMVGKLLNTKYGRDHELESDQLGVRFMYEARYNPNSLIRVMEVLKAAGGGGKQPEFFSTHPNPENRIERIKEEIERYAREGTIDR